MSKEEFTSVLSKNQGIIFKVANSYCNNIDDRDEFIQKITRGTNNKLLAPLTFVTIIIF